jgi:hypothetical protein
MRSKEIKFIFGEGGVSETVGFILIFGIVMAGIGIVTLYGYPMLMQEQQNTNIKNMEKNFLVLQSDLKSLTFKNVPYQETAIQVSGGTLSIERMENPPDSGRAHFQIDIPDLAVHSSFFPGELRFISNDGTVTLTLENGALQTVYWSSPNGSAMLANPSWYFDSETNTLVIQLIQTNASEYLAQTGIGTVKMELIASSPLPCAMGCDVTNKDVEISYHKNSEWDYHIAWKNYFSGSEFNGIMFENPPNSGTYQLDTIDDGGNDEFVKNLVIKTYYIKFLSL